MVGIIIILFMLVGFVVFITIYAIADENGYTPKIDNFIFNVFLSLISPITLFIMSYYLALEISISATYSAFSNNFLGRGSAFEWEDTWWVWLICLVIISIIELKLFSLRKKSFYFSKTIFKFLFYLSLLSTILATIDYFMSWNVQQFSSIGRSTRDGYMLKLFFMNYSLPVILWLLYYVILKNYDRIKIFLKKIKDQKNTKTKALKRNQAIKELKEAKELLDLGIISKEEYNSLSKKLKPMILKKKS
tara:strand:+ start:300 stop:1040 length:741 start_codon:yes stop_codon:yes gene_type:complete